MIGWLFSSAGAFGFYVSSVTSVLLFLNSEYVEIIFPTKNNTVKIATTRIAQLLNPLG